MKILINKQKDQHLNNNDYLGGVKDPQKSQLSNGAKPSQRPLSFTIPFNHENEECSNKVFLENSFLNTKNINRYKIWSYLGKFIDKIYLFFSKYKNLKYNINNTNLNGFLHPKNEVLLDEDKKPLKESLIKKIMCGFDFIFFLAPFFFWLGLEF